MSPWPKAKTLSISLHSSEVDAGDYENNTPLWDPNDKLAFNSRILNPPYNHNTLNGMTQSYLVRCIKSQTIITGHYTRPILSVRLYGRGYVDHKRPENLHFKMNGLNFSYISSNCQSIFEINKNFLI